MRKHWIDNLRWVTVLLVLLYHVVYFYNNKGVFGGIGGFGEYPEVPQYLGSPLNCLYGWLMCLAMMGWFKAKFNSTGAFAAYMTRSSYGLYIVHYLVIDSLGYMMKIYTQLPPWSMYVILTVAVFTLSPLLYEVIRRIPLMRWCIFGEK